jgi:hypothetical protein
MVILNEVKDLPATAIREMLHSVQHDSDGETGETPCGGGHFRCLPSLRPMVILHFVRHNEYVSNRPTSQLLKALTCFCKSLPF